MSFMHCSTMGHLIKALIRGGTAEYIAEQSGHTVLTVMKYMRQWHRQGVVYIADYYKHDRKHARPAAVWAIRTEGQLDAIRPVMTNQERVEVYKARKAAKRKLEAKLERVRGSV